MMFAYLFSSLAGLAFGWAYATAFIETYKAPQSKKQKNSLLISFVSSALVRHVVLIVVCILFLRYTTLAYLLVWLTSFMMAFWTIIVRASQGKP